MPVHHLTHSAPMTSSMRALAAGLLSVVLLPGCVFDGSDTTDGSEEAIDPAPGISVTVPPERLTPFCQAMTELTDRVRSGDEMDDDLIIETYRSIVDDVPAEIADDFALVLEALEAGAPPPTDPPRATIETLPRPDTTPAPSDTASTTAPTTTSTTTTTTMSASEPDTAGEASPPESTVPGSVVVDERYDRDGTPAERINSYVSFACRDVDNNPGPPATEPLGDPPATDDG